MALLALVQSSLRTRNSTHPSFRILANKKPCTSRAFYFGKILKKHCLSKKRLAFRTFSLEKERKMPKKQLNSARAIAQKPTVTPAGRRLPQHHLQLCLLAVRKKKFHNFRHQRRLQYCSYMQNRRYIHLSTHYFQP